MRVALCIPTCHPDRYLQSAPLWHDAGYELWTWFDMRDPRGWEGFWPLRTLNINPYGSWMPTYSKEQWSGWPTVTNYLCQAAVASGVSICVIGGDDISPDPSHPASEIAASFLKRFPDLYGVMQPTGDPYGDTGRAAVSAWVGAEFVRRHGPLHSGYHHYYADRELADLARSKGVYWEAPEYTQYHDHWTRNGGQKPSGGGEAHKHDRLLYETRSRKGLPFQ